MTPGEVRVREAALTDLAAVERIERASFDDPWPTLALLQELAPSRLRLPLAAESEGELVGYLMAWRTPDQLHILNVAVDPDRRRRGIASVLLEAALAVARQEGLREVTLEVRPGNHAALALYRRHGFAAAGLRPGYYADTGEDALVLTRDLAAE